ncbi:MAG TPA: hypothetical protein VKS78_10125 [Roseiarcus sp.]|nr:hypothetical protein [Roseiarcus sp.]
MGVNVEKDQIGAAAVAAGGDINMIDPVANGRDAAAEAVEAERNPIFDSLVKVEGEVSGLVAYSIYKQNKRAWLNDFQKIVGRPPSEAETRAYIIGESTDRRLATYRHLAQATLAGQGPEGPIGAKKAGGLSGRSAWFYVVWAVVLVAAVAVLGYALHFNLPIAK